MKVFLGCLCAVLAVLNVILALDEEGFEATEEKDGPAVTRAALAAATTSDPANCHLLYTQELMEQMTGETGAEAVAACEARESGQTDGDASGQVQLGEFQGAQVVASVSVEGGHFDGATFEMELRYEYNLWRVNRILHVDVDRDDFERAMRKEMADERLTPPEADCIVRAWHEIPEDDLEAAMIDAAVALDLLDPEETIGCLSAKSQRRMLAKVLTEAGRSQGEDEDVIACVGREIRDLPAGLASRVLRDMGGDDAERTLTETVAACRAESESLSDV